MPPKKQKKIFPQINEIMIVNNKKLTPYLELVNFSSRNIDQKKLGTILGIFEIKDLSDDSAYIVNFLSSVAKKTYFAGHQKNPEESFESTLAKVNLSLAEIANHGNVNWIGNIDAVLCCLFDNQINFSVSGDAKVLLLRNQKLMEISESLSPKDEAANPLKTFTDIASGRLEKGDKLILTTDDISHVFTLEDLEKNALDFDNAKFIRFLRTALVNELEIAGTMVLDIDEKIQAPEKNILLEEEKDLSPEIEEKNLFGSAAFERKNQDSVKNEIEKKSAEKVQEKTYTNQKTGHIYITESDQDFDSPQENKFEEWLIIAREKMSDFGFWLKENYLRKINYKIKKNLEKLFKKPTDSFDSTEEKISPIEIKPSSNFQTLSRNARDFSRGVRSRLDTMRSNQKEKSSESFLEIPSSPKTSPKINPVDKITGLLSKIKFNFEKFTAFFTFIIPRFSKIKNTFLTMSPKLKIITLLLILFIIIAPFWFFRDNSKNISTINQPPPTNEDLKINPSSEYYKEAGSLYQGSDLIGVFVFDNTVFLIGRDKITSVTEKKDYPFPTDFQNARLYSFMNDLNLLFLLDENDRLLSFSPISLRFNNDQITIPNNAKIEAIESYLTYLYIIDSANRQIYRYPRAENGFGERTDWLQSESELEGTTGLAIDGSLYLTKKDSLLKFFNRKSEDFNLQKDSDSSLDKIFSNDKLSALYILDKTNGELDKYDKSGNKQSFVSNQELTKTLGIWIDEKSSLAYFVTPGELFKIELPQ